MYESRMENDGGEIVMYESYFRRDVLFILGSEKAGGGN